jgi:hypothetical protein
MDEHTHGTLRFWRESTPTHDIKFAAGKLQTPGTGYRVLSTQHVQSPYPVRKMIGGPSLFAKRVCNFKPVISGS